MENNFLKLSEIKWTDWVLLEHENPKENEVDSNSLSFGDELKNRIDKSVNARSTRKSRFDDDISVSINRQVDIFEGTIAIGNPIVLDAVEYLKLTEKLDPAMELLTKNFRYNYLRVPISFRPSAKEQIAKVTIDFQLLDNQGTSIAWSMEPIKVEREYITSLNAKVGGKLKLSGNEAGGEICAKEEVVVYQPTVTAFNLGRNDPAWEFQPTKGLKLQGVFILHMVVQSERDEMCLVRYSIRGEVVRKGNLLKFQGKNKLEGEKFGRFWC